MTPTEQDKEQQFCESCNCMTRGNPTCGKCGAWRDTETITPTEQDKELFENSFGEWLENHGVELSSNNPSHLGTWRAMVDMNELKLAIMQLITADRKRVALEARIETLDYVIDLQSKQFNRWTQTDIANFFDGVGKYYRELKAQQEVK